MTLPTNDPRLESPLDDEDIPPPNVQDIIPPSERNEDVERTEMANGLTLGESRPLTREEKKAADRDDPLPERVYAPASARVPVDPAPGDRQIVEHPDTHTAEREAAVAPTISTEPAFTRVTRPTATYTPESSTAPDWKRSDAEWSESNSGPSRGTAMGIGFGWVALTICGGLGVWLWLRWKRQRNKPINRLRRQARQTAGELRDRVPTSPEEAVKPAAGLTSALLTILLVLWQQAQSRSQVADSTIGKQAGKVSKHADRLNKKADQLSKKADQLSKKAGKASQRADKNARHAVQEAVSELDWQQRLTQLKERWDPSRLELEKISISRH